MYKSFFVELFPDIDVQGKFVMANNTPLKDLDVVDVQKNIVILRESGKSGFFAEGYTLVYFMDSEASAQDLKDGKIPYLMIPRGTFYSGGSPITDIWKKKFQKPGTEHILGILEGHSDENKIYIDMISVRPKYQKNTIATKMVHMLRRNYPNAKISHSSATSAGEKFNRSYQKTVPPEQWGGQM
jgi:hypothetical protein